jgi:hypothetical protein
MRLLIILVCVLVLAIGGFLVFLGVWDIPAPSGHIEKVIPNDRISR